MTTISRGAVGAHNTLASQWERDVEDDIRDLVGEEGKVTKVASMLGSMEAKSYNHEWFVREHRSMLTTLSATPSGATTDLTWSVTDDNIFGIGDIVSCPNGETCRVSAKTHGASPTITVESRSRGTIAADTLASGDEIYNLGNAADDGSDLEEAFVTQDAVYENPVQLFFRRIEFDGTTLAVNEKNGIYGGDYEAGKRGDVMKELLQKMDMASLFGEAATSAGVGSDSVRTMGGIREAIPASQTSTIATLNQAALENFAATKGMLHGPDEMLVICNNLGAVGLNSYATTRIEVSPGGKKLGYDLKEYVTPIGKLWVMPHYNLSVGTTHDGLFLFVPKSGIKKAVLRPMKLHGDINVGTRDVKTDAWLGQHTLCFPHPQHMSEINGVTAYA